MHEDGVDFTLISPALLAIALFVLLPALAAALVVLLVERWDRHAPWQGRRLTTVAATVLAGIDLAAESGRIFR